MLAFALSGVVAAPLLAGGTHVCIAGCGNCATTGHGDAGAFDGGAACCCDPDWHPSEKLAWQAPCECATANTPPLPPVTIVAVPDAPIVLAHRPLDATPIRRANPARSGVIPPHIRGPPPDAAMFSTVLRC